MIAPDEAVVRREPPRLQSEACELVERCAAGELSPAVALLRLLMICGDAAAARAALERLAGQADADAIAAMQALLRGMRRHDHHRWRPLGGAGPEPAEQARRRVEVRQTLAGRRHDIGRSSSARAPARAPPPA